MNIRLKQFEVNEDNRLGLFLQKVSLFGLIASYHGQGGEDHFSKV